MNYNPNEERQDKLTTKILIEHALTQVRSQQILAIELDEPESRISEAKKGKSTLKTTTANLLIEKYGLPQNAFGDYKEDCLYLDSNTSIESFLSSRNNLQLSIVIEKLIQKLKLSISPNRDNKSDIIEEDIKINDLLQDKQFIEIANNAVVEFYKTYDKGCDSFERTSYYPNQLETYCKTKCVDDLLEQYHLSGLFFNKERELKKLLYVAYAIDVCNKRKDTLVVHWVNLCGHFNNVEKQTDIVITGSKVISEDWCDRKLDVFTDRNDQRQEVDDTLIKIINELVYLVPDVRGFNGPLASFIRESCLIKLSAIEVYYKEKESTFSLVLSVEYSDKIDKLY